MVGATAAVFFVARTAVSDIGTMVFCTHAMVAIPETRVFARRPFFRILKSLGAGSRKMVAGFDATVFVSDPKAFVSNTMVNASHTMVEDDG